MVSDSIQIQFPITERYFQVKEKAFRLIIKMTKSHDFKMENQELLMPFIVNII